MTKKLVVGLIPLLVAVAFAMVPAAAQAAEPVYYSEGAQLPEGEEIPTVSWGNITYVSNVAGEISCHTDIGGTAVNRRQGGILIGWTYVYDYSAWLCVANYGCPVRWIPMIRPYRLPWLDVLRIVKGKVRDAYTGVRFGAGCEEPETGEFAGTNIVNQLGGNWEPLAPAGAKKGTSALHPGFSEFDPEAGGLEVEGSNGTSTVTAAGSLKTEGLEHQEHIWAEP